MRVPCRGALAEACVCFPQAADEEGYEAADAVRAQMENAHKKAYDTYELVSYAKQLVSGMNYFLKIFVGDEYIHARVHKDFGGNYRLISFHSGKDHDHELHYF